MTTKSYSTQGGQLYFPNVANTVVAVAQMTGFTGLGGKKSKIDITNYDSVNYKEYAGGLIDAGELNFDLIWDFTNVNHKLVQSLVESANASRSFFFGASDGTAAPTYNAGLLVVPNAANAVTRSGFLFYGYFSMFQVDAPVDNIIKVKAAVQQSGGITTYAKGDAYP